MPSHGRYGTQFDDLTEGERAALDDLERSAEWESGYSVEHATKPQTTGNALVDSPVALAAWVIEKVWSWTDHDGNVERVLTRDELLDNLMLYWLPRAGASSARLYWESIRQVNGWISGSVMDDLLVLFRGLPRDPRVLRSAKLWLGVGVVWIASPIDLVPGFIPIAGPLDDAIVAALRHLASGASTSTSPPECWLLPPREQSFPGR